MTVRLRGNGALIVPAGAIADDRGTGGGGKGAVMITHTKGIWQLASASLQYAVARSDVPCFDVPGYFFSQRIMPAASHHPCVVATLNKPISHGGSLD